MGSRILYELSQAVSLLLEEGLRRDGGRHTPVYFCHPLDPLEDEHEAAQGTFGILYMTRIAPDPGLRQTGLDVSSLFESDVHPRLRRPSLWIRVRYVFLVAGGDIEQQLVALASVLQTLHDHQSVRILRSGEAGGGPEDEPDPDAERDADPHGESATDRDIVCPLRWLEHGEGWREVGLPEHRLTLAFEVTCPLLSAWSETVERIQERGLSIEESPS